MFLPEIINRDPKKNYDQSGKCIFWLVNEQNNHYSYGGQNVDRRDHRVTESFVRTGNIRSFYPQNENRKDGQGEEDERCKDHIIEQVAVSAR